MSIKRVVAAEISYRFLSAVLSDSTLVKHPKQSLWGDLTFSFLGEKVPETVDADLNHLFNIEMISTLGGDEEGFDSFARHVAEGRDDNQDMLIRLADFFAKEADGSGVEVANTEYWDVDQAHRYADAVTEHVPHLAKLVAA
ncbi:MAG: hypothetical protein HRT94_00735 [Alphaproteobacteria bacterium]|nr:hypothetical protein [Alphaproteobacteria bacterium]